MGLVVFFFAAVLVALAVDVGLVVDLRILLMGLQVCVVSRRRSGTVALRRASNRAPKMTSHSLEWHCCLLLLLLLMFVVVVVVVVVDDVPFLGVALTSLGARDNANMRTARK